MPNPDAIRSVLLVDEGKLQEQLLNQARTHLALDNSGRVHLHDAARYTAKIAVGLVLVGRRYAADAGLTSSDCVTIDDVVAATSMDPKSVANRLGELKSQGFVESPEKGSYRVNMARARQLMNEADKCVTGGAGGEKDVGTSQ